MNVSILSLLRMPNHWLLIRPSFSPSLDEAMELAHDLICLPNIASKKWVWEQYDSMVGTLIEPQIVLQMLQWLRCEDRKKVLL